MSTLKQIIINTVTNILRHEPTDAEIAVMLNYLKYSIRAYVNENKKLIVDDINLSLLSCRDDCFVACAYSGGYYLKKEMRKNPEGEFIALENWTRYEQDASWLKSFLQNLESTKGADK